MEINLLDDEDWFVENAEPGYRWRRKRVAGEHLGASLYELPPGEATWPFHYELGIDELVVVVAGFPTLRTSAGERVLLPGDCVFFPDGPAGAHQIVNRSDETVRVLFASSFCMPRAGVQPDSGKIMIRWGTERDERLLFPLDGTVDYYDGEKRGSTE